MLSQCKKYKEVMSFQDYTNNTERVLKQAKDFKNNLKDLEPQMRKLLDSDSIELIV